MLFFIAIQAVELTTTSAFAPISTNNIPRSILASTNASPTKKGTQLNYLREEEMDGIATMMDPMEEAFDNMKHPMELMLLSRACIPYVAEGRPAQTTRTIVANNNNNNDDDDDDIDPCEKAFDNMKHPMEILLLNRACIPHVAEGRPAQPKATVCTQTTRTIFANNNKNNNDDDDTIDPMEEAFDNMKHPMELMLLNRACIPYVAEKKIQIQGDHQ
jgi:uncharacterized protein Yka (UPF0111/DUF47 family)